MSIALCYNSPTQWIESPHQSEPYPRQVVVDFGRPELRYGLSVRELVHWFAYRLDTADNDYITNHRLAVLLRAIAEHFYPFLDDETELLVENLQDSGCTDDLSFELPNAPDIDVRLLNLIDGFVVCDDAFVEALWGDEERTPALVRGEQNYLDVVFPPVVFDWFGIRGLRVHTLDLINLISSAINRTEMAYQDQEAWLDMLELAKHRNAANHDFRFDAYLRARHGDGRVDDLRNPESRERGTVSPEEQDTILEELKSLI